MIPKEYIDRLTSVGPQGSKHRVVRGAVSLGTGNTAPGKWLTYPDGSH